MCTKLVLQFLSQLDETIEMTNTNGSYLEDELDSEEYLDALGTRPPLPMDITCIDDYTPIIGLFHCCTDENPDNRPNASTVVNALEPIITQRGITA